MEERALRRARPLRDRPVGVIATTWRGGSTWLYYRFKSTYPEIEVHHEGPFDVMIARPGLNIGWPIARDLPLYHSHWGDIATVHIVRDPVAVAVSAFRQALVRSVEDALDSWVAIHERILHEHGVEYLRLRAEDIWANHDLLHQIAGFLKLPLRTGLAGDDDRTAAATEAVTIPAFTVPSRVQVLADYFGYDVPDEVDEMTFEHDTVTRDAIRAEKLARIV